MEVSSLWGLNVHECGIWDSVSWCYFQGDLLRGVVLCAIRTVYVLWAAMMTQKGNVAYWLLVCMVPGHCLMIRKQCSLVPCGSVGSFPAREMLSSLPLLQMACSCRKQLLSRPQVMLIKGHEVHVHIHVVAKHVINTIVNFLL